MVVSGRSAPDFVSSSGEVGPAPSIVDPWHLRATQPGRECALALKPLIALPPNDSGHLAREHQTPGKKSSAKFAPQFP